MLNKLNHNTMKTYKYTKAQIRTVINSMNDYDTIHESQNGLMKTSFYVENGVCQAITRKYDDASWQVEYEFDIEKNIDWLHKEFGNATNIISALTFYCYAMSNPVK